MHPPLAPLSSITAPNVDDRPIEAQNCCADAKGCKQIHACRAPLLFSSRHHTDLDITFGAWVLARVGGHDKANVDSTLAESTIEFQIQPKSGEEPRAHSSCMLSEVDVGPQVLPGETEHKGEQACGIHWHAPSVIFVEKVLIAKFKSKGSECLLAAKVTLARALRQAASLPQLSEIGVGYRRGEEGFNGWHGTNKALERQMLRKAKQGSRVGYWHPDNREKGSCGVKYDNHYNPKVEQRKGNTANLCSGDS
ncbi:hypothetical protein FA13DRAFT_1707134 [Coprinellus micaceus]|uniref:Uncharacterized protein n=1 Tax=Coprinellus micaceus TaxID=71717 RepID=A0A4Y7TL66_COPMI|nr:hypothetical protein FA13DRAFT_1707134 [Coprinellus micaceus]